jgi:hypothetical protein
MTRIRTSILSTACAALLGAALTPALASAGSLLSGYGGPGQGSQAILGSTLLNGPRGGGSSGPSAGEATPAAVSEPAAARAAASPAPTTIAPSSKATSRRAAGAGGGKREGHRAPAGAAQAASPAYIVSRHADQPLLGISGGDLLAMIVAAGVLVFVGGLTRRAARSGAQRRPPKAIGSDNRADG